ncbi:MAG: SGNH/GDSL hydrolase family protein [Lachnospiraceae bacterium]|nr:SGNH/GDSL hydrolase family protein [Lachnospiraceae bacterium]
MFKRIAAALVLSVVFTSLPVSAEELVPSEAAAPAIEEDASVLDDGVVNDTISNDSVSEDDFDEDDEADLRPKLANVVSIPDGFNDVFVPKSVSEINAPEGATFESSDDDIARVGNKSGIIQVLKPGLFSVTMTIGEASVSFNYYVEKPKAIQKTISMNYLTQVYSITQNISGNEYTAPTDFWSSDEDVAIVDDDGNVTAIGNGTATIFTYFGRHLVKTKVEVDADENAGPILPVAINSKVSILGDSWSAFAPDIKAYYRHDYYYGEEFTENDMWWGDLDIEKNNSVGGSGVICQPQALNSRESDLGTNPGIIVIQLGANDYIFGCWSKDNYDQMLKNVKAAYPNAMIFCGTYANIGNGDSGSLNADIKDAAANNNCYIIDNDSLTLSFFTDYIHPDPYGMATLKENMQKVLSKYLPGGENDILNQKIAAARGDDDEEDADAEEDNDESDDSAPAQEGEEAKTIENDPGDVDSVE